MTQQLVIKTGRTIFLPYIRANDTEGIGLTGVATETKICSTPQLTEDVRVLGGTTDIDASTIMLGDGSGGRPLSSTPIPARHMFGRRASAEPYEYYPAPRLLRKGDTLQATVVNVGGEGGANAPGHLVHICEPAGVEGETITVDEGQIQPFWLDVAAVLTGAASELKEVATPVDRLRETIVWGAATDLDFANVRMWDALHRPLTGEWTPIWAIAGLRTGQVASFRWPRPYLLRAGEQLRFAFRDTTEGAEANGHLFLKCSKLPRRQ